MASTLVPVILQQLAVNVDRDLQEEVRLVTSAKKEVIKLTSILKSIEAVLNDAEKRQLQEKTVEDWVAKLKDISYDIDDVIDEWSTAIRKARNAEFDEDVSLLSKVCSCFNVQGVFLRREIALKIKKLNGRLDVIAREKDLFMFNISSSIEEPDRPKTTSVVDVSEICGREEDKDKLVGYLMNEIMMSTSQVKRSLHVICIKGMGGIGKTTLAQLAFNDEQVKACFDIRVWICVSDPFDEIRIVKAIIENIEKNAPNIIELETLLQRVRDLVVGKKFLLVLDDVWTEDYQKWESLRDTLKCGVTGSRIVVTTRNGGVARMMESSCILPLGKLSEDDCWLLFSRIAFSGREAEECEKVEDVGREIAHKCNGLPLAAKTLGSLMRFKKSREEWQDILESEIWNLQEAERGLFPPLLLSYYDLPSPVRRCFSYCAFFPKDYKIVKNELIKLWMAQGFLSSRAGAEMELTGREYFENLATRCFFQDFERDQVDGSIKRCKMHDIVHDFAQFLTKNECRVKEVSDLLEEKRSDNPDSTKTRHSTVVIAAPAPFPTSTICNAEKLRTLFIRHDDNKGIASAFPDLCRRLTCLRSLNMRNSLIEDVPEELGRLLHLRYLNLSNTKLKELPETIGNLRNLQTLNLTGCQCLQRLPQGVGKLVNLRHLEIGGTLSMRVLPKGIGRLDSLRTLSRFLVSGGGGVDEEACQIEDLRKLNFLRRKLRIEGLGNVADVKKAEKAQLKMKKRLQVLELQFTGRHAERRLDEAVLEALQPHSEIEHITISRHNGTTIIPSWMMLLSKLRRLVLENCGNCKFLPPLGRLQALESLGLFYMNKVEMVGVEFLGLETENGSLESSSPVTLFPHLKELSFCGMGMWETWDGMSTKTGKEDIDNNVRITPCLRYLHITDCPKLMALPHYLQRTQPQELVINSCPLLKQHVIERAGENWDKISHIPNIKIDDSYVQGQALGQGI